MCSEVKIASHVLSNLYLVFIKPKFFSQKYFCLLPCKDRKQRCYRRHGLRVFLHFETLWLNNHQREIHQWSPPTSQFINSSQFGKNVISFGIIRYPDISQNQFNGLTYFVKLRNISNLTYLPIGSLIFLEVQRVRLNNI